MESYNTKPPQVRGRGATENPVGRFEPLDIAVDYDPEWDDQWEEGRQVKTQIFRDTSRTIIARNDSPDVSFNTSVNPYRGCEHGCIYCFARPTHEYLGLSAGLDFETKIFAKTDAPALLRAELMKRSWQPQVIAMSGVTDCYQPIERKMELTRGCLRVLAEFRNPVGIITKNHLVTRDIDLIGELAEHDAAMVHVSVTTLDRALARAMEPRASTPAMRLKAIASLSQAGIPTTVMIGPVLPGLNDHEIPAILEAGAAAGARHASYVMLRLPYGLKDLFRTWLETHYPDRAARVMNRIRDVRHGDLNDPNFGSRMTGTGPIADQVKMMFQLYRRKYGLDAPKQPLSTEHFRRPAQGGQLSLF